VTDKRTTKKCNSEECHPEPVEVGILLTFESCFDKLSMTLHEKHEFIAKAQDNETF
jgi:hypothetical protein